VYICGDCLELCQSIIEQERRRRTPVASPMGPGDIQARLDQLIGGQEEAKRALALAAWRREECARGKQVAQQDRDHVLLGPSRSSKVLLARALAHALEAPFADGDATILAKVKSGIGEIVPLLYRLLPASGFVIEAAQRGVVYVDGIDRAEAQEALLHFWDSRATVGRMQLDVRRILFVCGGAFAGLD
jgi:ATP-dependent Clp protease ATP-binding subunit ClpX